MISRDKVGTNTRDTEKKNRNDQPLITPDTSIRWVDYEDHHQFHKLGEITFGPNTRGNEKMIFSPLCEDRRALVYALVVDGYIQKIGKTATTFKDRTQSYDCGKDSYRKNVTCSTTNWFVRTTLKNFFNKGHKIEIYAYHMKATKVEYGFGLFREDFSDPKELEKTILAKMKKQNKFPVLCTQR